MSLQFQEFQALRRRQAATKAARDEAEEDTREDDGAASVVSESSYASATRDDEASASSAAGDTKKDSADSVPLASFFETYEVQLVVLCLIALDVAFSVASIVLTCGDTSDTSGLVRAVLQTIHSFTGFTVFFFLLELLALMASFRSQFFYHVGNVLDLAVVAVCLVWEIDGRSRGIRLLGILRFWRVMRLVNTLLTAKEAKLQETKDAWDADLQVLEETRVQIARLEDNLRRELDSKKRVETMLRSYKDEVETLNEALKIAALDIAQAAGEQLESDEEDEGEEHVDGDQATGLSASKPKSNAPKAPTTIFVSEDGTYRVNQDRD